jgi:hypothetical protein
MKRVFLSLCVATALFACNSSDNKTADEPKMGETKVAAMSATDMPYQVKDWGDWQPGNMENAKTAMASLKSFCDGNLDACAQTFGDSAELRFDDMVGKFSNDSLKKMLVNFRSMSKSIDVDMNDFESVKSKDGKQEWVTLWYKQKWEDQKGMWDSAVYTDDLKFENGKITVLDEKTRHYPKKK